MRVDMAQNVDLGPDLATVDIAQNPNGTAQLTIADVEGQLYLNPVTKFPYSHLVLVQNSLPAFNGTPQYVDPGFSASPGAIHGCTANRYDLASATGPFPTPSENAGAVSFTGYNVNVSARTPNGPAATLGVFNPPIPATINCAWGGAMAPFYGCIYGTSFDASATVDGTPTGQVSFPGLPAANLGGSCAAIPGYTTHGTGMAATCEPHPFIAGMTVIKESIGGGGSYGALNMKSVPGAGALPAGVTVISVNGATPADPFDPLAGVVLNGSQDVIITWSCDGTMTPGGGCPMGALGLADILGLLAITSQNKVEAFAQSTNFGAAQCAEQVGSASATVTLTKAAQTQLLQGQAAGTGSILLALVRLKAAPSATMGHSVFFTAGIGNFVLLNR